jgi:UDP-N-acetylmuramoylalanine--D-glutamate ligase
MNIARFQKPGDIFIREAATIPLPDHEIPLLGAHNKHNVGLAVAVARELGVSDAQIATAIKSFRPLPHRLERVGEFRGIIFYDNASSTTPESTVAALEALSNVDTILLGGLDRGYGFTKLITAIEEAGIQNVVLFPATGARIKALLPPRLKTFETERMEEAVRFAYAKTAPGKIVLLSTASPSYSLWTNFSEQGNEFQKWARALA